MNIFEIDPLADARWNAFIAGNDDSSIYHTSEWLQALKNAYGYEAAAFTESPPGSALTNAIVFCKIRSALTGNRLVSLPFSDYCAPLTVNPDQIAAIVSNLVARVDQREWKYFELRPVSAIPDIRDRLAIGKSYILHRIDLRPKEEQLFKSFHKDCVQRKIRRAERESLRYEEGVSDNLLFDFYKMQIGTRRRQGIPPQPLKWYRSLIHSMNADLKIRVAYKNEIPVAGIVTITHKATLVYKYGCSDARYNNLGAMPMLFWRAIQDAKSHDLEVFDLGRSDLDNPGLITFKEHWSPMHTKLDYWRYPARAAADLSPTTLGHLRRMVSNMPDAPLTLLGRLLYKHIG